MERGKTAAGSAETPATDALVEIHDVELAPPDRERLLDFGLGSPSPGSPGRTGGTYALEVRGWVEGKGSELSSVDIYGGLTCMRRIPLEVYGPEPAADPGEADAARSRFYSPVSTLPLAPNFEFSIEASFRDGTRARMATVRGRRATLRSQYKPAVQPLLVTTMGRSGSTVLMRALASHPQIVAYDPLESEVRTATYWTYMLLWLTDPLNYLRQLVPGGLPFSFGPMVVEGPSPPPIGNPGMLDSIGGGGVEALASFCQSRIDAFYHEVASQTGRPGVTYFAEKSQSGFGGRIPSSVPSLLSEVYPGLREVMLVRDFRDIVCSWMSFSARRSSSRRPPDTSNEQYIRALGIRAQKLARHWRERSAAAHLVRYEDLVLRPNETIADLLRYVGVDADEPTVDSLARVLSEPMPAGLRHQTSDSVEQSIGRWRTDLDQRLLAVTEQALGAGLDAFGYPRSGTHAP